MFQMQVKKLTKDPFAQATSGAFHRSMTSVKAISEMQAPHVIFKDLFYVRVN